MSSTRQLAAIMFTDIVGYTAMMGANEKKAFELLRQNRQLQKPLIEAHGGVYVKELGDGTLASFTSVIEAVNCACRMIKGCAAIDGLHLRIGIHLGDVIFENGDVFGDSVNIASRLQSLAPVGGIWISESVHKNISNKQGIISTFVREETLKNVKEPIHIYEVDINSFHEGSIPAAARAVPSPKKIILDSAKPAFALKKIMLWVLPLLVLGLLAATLVPSWKHKQNARLKLIPEIQKLVDSDFRPPVRAFELASQAEKYISKDSALIKLWPLVATLLTLDTEPSGAEVYWKDYDQPKSDFQFLGTTPLVDVRIPMTYIRMEIRKENFQTIEYAVRWSRGAAKPEFSPLTLDPVGSLAAGMVRIPGGETAMSIVGLESSGPRDLSAFLMDKYEVTNEDFKTFVDAGGYANKSFWKHDIHDGKSAKTFEEGIKLFLDRTGQQGPASWEAGTYPDGKAKHPVTGVSWYEAAAYAEFVGKQLPTVFHWSIVAATSRTENIAPLSNLKSTTTVPVGSRPGYSTFGIYDMAGNAREWCQTANGINDQRYILGGGFSDPTYSFNDSYMQPALSRGLSNGFRCMMLLPGDTTMAQLPEIVKTAFRDYSKEQPVDDQTFAQIRNQYNYDKTPLNEKIDETLDREQWTIEKVSIDAAYGRERMDVYLYIPKNHNSPPYQAVIFFPGSGDIFSTKYNPDFLNGVLDFIMKSGRVLVVPVYKGTHERHDELNSDLPSTTVFYKDHVIMWRKDISRAIDYLETRSDINHDGFGYLGWSWGGYMGGILPAIEKRLTAIVLNVGGMVMNESLPEADQLNFLPRITQPVLMLNGKHDMYFPVETSQKPMFRFLGTPPEHKKMILYESGHLVPRTDFIGETLKWYDTYLGTVK